MSASRVAVVRGGSSIEREVSIRGARRVTAALRAAGNEVVELEIDHTIVDQLRAQRPAYAVIVAHGANGEDGTLQGLLELLDVPYTGSDSLASALCIDKVVSKRLLARAGLPTPAFIPFSRRTFQDLGAAMVLDDVMARLGAPVVVKPARLGSSFGIKLVPEPGRLRTAVLGSVAYDDEILVEQHIAGRELAVTVLAGPDGRPRALPIVEILSSGELYDYEAHYDFAEVSLDAPATLEPSVAGEVERVAIAAFETLGCRDLARVDLILDSQQRPQILELNTIPGLTETGPTPFAAEAAGMSFGDLVAAIARRAAAEGQRLRSRP